MPLKLYYRTDWLPPGASPIHLLQIFLGPDPLEYDPSNLLGPAWQEFFAQAREWFELTPENEAECAVYPVGASGRAATTEEHAWIARQRAAGRPTLVIAGGDRAPGPGWEDAMVLANN
jgi:hypothetical protein